MGLIADLLKEIPSAARYKSELEALERELADLKRECSTLREQVGALQLTNGKLRSDLEGRAGQRLADEREGILLKLLDHDGCTEAELANLAGLSAARTRFLVRELKNAKLLSVHYQQGSEWTGTEPRAEYSVSHEGMTYLEAHGLLK